jgi:NTP pyrophosphatase (non-canonical NTP hydrolase)
MDLTALQMEIRKRYHETDSKSGKLFLLAVLFEETGELAEAVRKGRKKEVEEEIADVIFMALSIANLFEITPEERIIEKYLKNDPSDRWDLPD